MDEMYVKAVNEQYNALRMEYAKLTVQMETVKAALFYWENKAKNNESTGNSNEE